MSAQINDGGPAFPLAHDVPPIPGSDRCILAEPGMSLRDYFAAKAMQGLCAGLQAGDNADAVPNIAYAMADAMLAERAKGGAA